MGGLPSDLKLTLHAKQRLEERKDPENYYNTRNLMRSSCKWYGIDDLIPESSLYVHARYVCRKAKNKMAYMTDGNIEVLFDKNAGVAITIMEVKEKFLPITQYIKPSVLRQIQNKKESKKMGKRSFLSLGTCPDCDKTNVQITSQGICAQCRARKANAKFSKRKYVPYNKLSEEDRKKVDTLQKAHTSKSSITETAKKPTEKKQEALNVSELDSKLNIACIISTLNNCGCEIPEIKLKEILNVLAATDKLKEILTTITENENQDAMLNLEHMLNVAERKLQHDWEYNGFKDEDDIKFKSFLTWRRTLKSAIYFWKKLYSTNTLLELQKLWSAYIADPTEKVVLSREKIDSIIKRYQISTETISTIYNTRRPFTRVFYAISEEEARRLFTQWLSDRQLHEDKSKTTVVELSSGNSFDGRKDTTEE